MLPTTTKVDLLIAQIWRRFPAHYRLNLVLNDVPIVLYSNSQAIIHELGCYFQDSVTLVSNARLLLSVVDLNIETDQGILMHAELRRVAADATNRQVKMVPATQLVQISADPRFLIVGDCALRGSQVIDFIESAGRPRRQLIES
ncbi:MAG: hypothetical protein ACI8W8_004961 [Rhodothermales bacterium]|jgi:hypothetical protein